MIFLLTCGYLLITVWNLYTPQQDGYTRWLDEGADILEFRR